MSQQSSSGQCAYFTPRVGLCALEAKLHAERFWEPIERSVRICQKRVKHQPIDKLKDCFIGLLSGISALYQTDKVVRADVAVQLAFGRTRCAQQSTIHDTLRACQPENVAQLRTSLTEIFRQYSRACGHDFSQQLLLLDLDLSSERTSKHAQQATKGYFPGYRNVYGRQHGRALAAQYDEIVVDGLYPGKTKLAEVLEAVIQEVEKVLDLSPAQRGQVVIRMDASGGYEESIDWLLQRGYQIHIKMFSWRRAAKLAHNVAVWYPSPGHPNREVGLVLAPHHFVQPTVQVAARSTKAKGGWSYNVVVSSLNPEQACALSGHSAAEVTQEEYCIQAYTDVYDDRSGPMEHSFGEDHQGLPIGKRHRHAFVAQEMLLLLISSAHNALVWAREWLAAGYPQVRDLGILRLVRDVLQVPGRIMFDATGRPTRIEFNKLDPLANEFVSGWRAVLSPLGIAVDLTTLRIGEQVAELHK